MVLDAAEDVAHVPIFGRAAGGGFAALHVAGFHVAVASGVGANGAAGDGTADGRCVIAAASADLVAENAADQGAGDRAADVRAVTLDDLLALDPAALVRRADHGVHGSNRHVEHALFRTAP